MTDNVLSRILRIPVAHIEIPDGGRSLRDDKVMDPNASMPRIGMLNSIGILALISTLLLGSRLLTAISGAAPVPRSEDA